MSNNTQNKGQRAFRKITYRHVLKSPYLVQWPRVTAEQTNVVVDRLSIMLNDIHTDSTSQSKENNDIFGKYFRFGLNNVTKSLEKREIAVVFLSIPNYESRQMFEHIPQLAYMHSADVYILSAPPHKIGKFVDKRSLLAFGITNDALSNSSVSQCLKDLAGSECKTYFNFPWLATRPPLDSKLISKENINNETCKINGNYTRAVTTSLPITAQTSLLRRHSVMNDLYEHRLHLANKEKLKKQLNPTQQSLLVTSDEVVNKDTLNEDPSDSSNNRPDKDQNQTTETNFVGKSVVGPSPAASLLTSPPLHTTGTQADLLSMHIHHGPIVSEKFNKVGVNQFKRSHPDGNHRKDKMKNKKPKKSQG